MEQSQPVPSNINPETMERVQNIISILPRAPLPSHLHQGFWCPALLIKGIIWAQKFFKAEPSDVFVCSAPKTGNTWIKALTFAIVTRNSFKNSTNPLLSKVPHDILPFYEADFHKSWPNVRQPGIPLLATHTPYTSLPKSVQDSECKIVYVCRDEKDTFVSHYHFAARLRSREQELQCNLAVHKVWMRCIPLIVGGLEQGLVELSKRVRVTIKKVRALSPVVPHFGRLQTMISVDSALNCSWLNMIFSAK